MEVEFSDGTTRNMGALIDKESEVSQINWKLVIPELYESSLHPLRLGAATSNHLEGRKGKSRQFFQGQARKWTQVNLKT